MNRLTVARVILIGLIWVGLVSSARAAPFCVAVTGLAPQCIYVDGNECQAQAARQNAACVPNPQDQSVPTSRVGDYCVILSAGGTRCGYADQNVCSRDALQQKGVCAKSADSTPQQLPNDFLPNAGR